MQQGSKQEAEHRRSPRLKLPPMYTLIRVRPHGHRKFCWTGHIYDISASGLRFELDAAVKPGTCIDVRATLPGAYSTTVSVSGHVVRNHDELDEPGPQRMGMIFDSFSHPVDCRRLVNYLRHSGLQQAA